MINRSPRPEHGMPRPATGRIRTASLPALLLTTAVCAAPLTRAEDVPRVPEPDSNHAAATKTPPSEPRDPAEIIGQTVELMRTAHKRLAAYQLDTETTRLQRQIHDELAQLVKLMEQQAAQHQMTIPDEQPQESAGQAGPATGGTGDPQSQSPQAGESSERPRGGDQLTDEEIERRKKLATAVWGHFPPRLRDKMHGAFSERFLPQYDALVRRYYEALATQGDSAP